MPRQFLFFTHKKLIIIFIIFAAPIMATTKMIQAASYS